jgi:HD-GYP domain-containing protein (c-di-GMP phosphodiesterase class II)
MAIADAYSAMTSNRPCRQAIANDDAIRELSEGAGTQFDPELVRIALRVLDETDELATALFATPPDESV